MSMSDETVALQYRWNESTFNQRAPSDFEMAQMMNETNQTLLGQHDFASLRPSKGFPIISQPINLSSKYDAAADMPPAMAAHLGYGSDTWTTISSDEKRRPKHGSSTSSSPVAHSNSVWSGVRMVEADIQEGDTSYDDFAVLGDDDTCQPMTAAEIRAQKRKMRRFRLTHNQTRFLMSEFARQPHPDSAHRERLSREIPGLSPRQVQVWFQNRRAKLKRLTSDDRERMLRSRALPATFDSTQALHTSLVAQQRTMQAAKTNVQSIDPYSNDEKATTQLSLETGTRQESDMKIYPQAPYDPPSTVSTVCSTLYPLPQPATANLPVMTNGNEATVVNNRGGARRHTFGQQASHDDQSPEGSRTDSLPFGPPMLLHPRDSYPSSLTELSPTRPPSLAGPVSAAPQPLTTISERRPHLGRLSNGSVATPAPHGLGILDGVDGASQAFQVPWQITESDIVAAQGIAEQVWKPAGSGVTDVLHLHEDQHQKRPERGPPAGAYASQRILTSADQTPDGPSGYSASCHPPSHLTAWTGLRGQHEQQHARRVEYEQGPGAFVQHSQSLLPTSGLFRRTAV